MLKIVTKRKAKNNHMTTKDKMKAIKEMLQTNNNKKPSKKELIDKVYADLEAKNKEKEQDITSEDMQILQDYANSQSPNDTDNQKTNGELSEEATKALKDFFSK